MSLVFRRHFATLSFLRAPWLAKHSPGLAASAAIVSLAASAPFATPIVPTSILIGVVAANTLPNSITARLKDGAKFSAAVLLRGGIVCVGAKLSLTDSFQYFSLCVPVILPTLAATITSTLLVARLLNLHKDFAVLMAAGTGICGVTAISTVSPVICAQEQYFSIAVANVIVFGMFGMLVYPWLIHTYLFPASDDNLSHSPNDAIVNKLSTSTKSGLLLGMSIHDSSQVLGAALSFRDAYNDSEAFNVATVTKLTRNMLLVFVVPMLSWLHSKMHPLTFVSVPKAASPPLLPGFVLGFMAMSAIRSLGDYAIARENVSENAKQTWKRGIHFVSETLGTTFFLGMAMAGVGLGTQLSVIKKVGWRPFYVGGVGASVGLASGYISIQIFSALRE